MLPSDRKERKETQRYRIEACTEQRRSTLFYKGDWKGRQLEEMYTESCTGLQPPNAGWSESTGVSFPSQGLAGLCGCLWFRGLESLARLSGVGAEQQVLAPRAGC